MPDPQPSSPNHYDLLGIKPTASPQQIRRAYRDLSKLYHPDTTDLPAAIAKEKFQALNEAYATLSSPDRRWTYDRKIGFSRIAVVQAPANLNQPRSQRTRPYPSNAYLDPTDRPLSAGEIFALFILGVTFVGCLVLAVTIGLTRGTIAFTPTDTEPTAAATTPPTVSQSGSDYLPNASSPAPDLQPNIHTVPKAPVIPSQSPTPEERTHAAPEDRPGGPAVETPAPPVEPRQSTPSRWL